jgi:hypothetical protein
MLGCAPQPMTTDNSRISTPTGEIVETSEPNAAPRAKSKANEEPISVRSVFTHDKDLNRALLDTRIAPPQKQTFWLGLGSVTIETVSVSDGFLTLRYTEEIEGSYSVSECEVEISSTPLVFQFGSDGTPGHPPDALRNCKPIRTGNVHIDLSNIENASGE